MRATDPDYDAICSAFEQNGFGLLTPLLLKQINELMDDYPANLIEQAMAMAASRGKRFLAYVRGILRNQSEDTDNANHQRRTPAPQPTAKRRGQKTDHIDHDLSMAMLAAFTSDSGANVD